MQAISCDIFCAVIDNLGDAGFCWRLARQLAHEHGWQVRLLIDKPSLICALAPGQTIVEIRPWPEDLEELVPAEIIIEAFACTLPSPYVAAMKARPRAPVWLNLEYLSAEPWVAACHGLPSPQGGLEKHFFFPGFVPGTGGLIRESGFAVPPAPTFDGSLQVSLFCYANPALPGLLDAWRTGDSTIVCHVCNGLPREQVEAWLGSPLATGIPVTLGALTLIALPFMPQTDYDDLLARCHLNFVRGEDSFVRAQWAERPFVWQAYPQSEGTHLVKLDAFLKLYTDDESTRAFFRAWNGDGPPDWPAFARGLPGLASTAPGWARRIMAPGDLANQLVKFCSSRL